MTVVFLLSLLKQINQERLTWALERRERGQCGLETSSLSQLKAHSLSKHHNLGHHFPSPNFGNLFSISVNYTAFNP